MHLTPLALTVRALQAWEDNNHLVVLEHGTLPEVREHGCSVRWVHRLQQGWVAAVATAAPARTTTPLAIAF